MKKTIVLFSALLFYGTAQQAYSAEPGNSLATLIDAAGAGDAPSAIAELPSVEIPEVGRPSADREALLADYDKYYAALEGYSDTAFKTPQESPAYLEAAAAGTYLRARLEGLEALLGSAPHGTEPERHRARESRQISWDVINEINDALGFSQAGERAPAGTRGVTIKEGYCQVNYVKNNTPFLVQHDGFLKKGEVIITFDDGPGPLTEEVTAAMKAGKAPSLFFVLGSKLGASGKALIKNSSLSGHEIGVHGYWHATESGKPFTALSGAETLRQLGGVKNSISGATGVAPKFFRPPYGIISPEVLRSITSDLGLIPVGWTIDTMDWSTKDPGQLFEKTVSMIKQRGRGIVLLHDIHPQSRTAAKRLVKWLADNGYTVVSPDRLAQAFRK